MKLERRDSIVSMLSIQQADVVAREVAREFGVPAPPPLYVTPNLPSQYAGAYYHNGEQHIKIRPEYFTERTISHEVGHYIFHHRAPGYCRGQSPECEQVARMIERWWLDKRRRERTLIDGKPIPQTVGFTLTKPMTLQEAKAVAERLRESEISESIDRVGFKDRYFYVVMKPVDGFVLVPFIPVIVAALALVGIGVVAWTTPLLAPGPLGLPNVVWILIAGTTLLVALGWALGKIGRK